VFFSILKCKTTRKDSRGSGEVSNSRGIVVPLRQTYTYPNTYLMFGKVFTKDKTINVIREDYDYYQKTN
jgi:hypothetical protein